MPSQAGEAPRPARPPHPAPRAGRYCKQQVAGESFTDGFFAIPFRKGTPAAIADALSSLIVTAVGFGDYGVGTALATFGGERPVCAAYLTQQAALQNSFELQPLSFAQLAGIFFVLARERRPPLASPRVPRGENTGHEISRAARCAPLTSIHPR